MVESLLRSNEIPQGLTRFMDTKTEGNPFYLEEMINSLVESGVLKQINDTWTLTREISSNDISATIHGLIAARLDRLKSTSKRVLQEASIIGRSFYHDIIRQISDITENMNECLGHLQSSDLIITHCLDPDIEYIFKHALTQEVVYNSVLLKERQQIHEKVGNVMEDLFKDRLPEFYESLAHHFSLGKSKIKAVDYLIKAAEKSMNRFSLQESHDFFSKAYEIILELPENQAGVDDIIVTLLNKWGFLFYYRGDFKSGLNIFSKHIKNIEKISDKEKIGMFYALYGYILFNSWKGEQGHEYLIKAKQIGHEIGNFEIVGYACAWLTFVYADAGRFKEGIEHGEAGLKLAKKNHLDHYVYYKCIGGLCYINVWIGDAAGSIEYGEHLIDYCEKHGQSRGLAIGYSFCKGAGEFCAGDFLTSIKSVEKAVAVSVDPLHNLASRHYLATVQLFLKRWEKGRQICGELVPLYESSGAHQINQGARLLLGLALAGIGELSKGEKLVLDALNDFETPFSLGKRPFHILAYAKLYYEIILGDTKPTLSVVMNNLGFILKNIPFAFKKAIYLYEKSISLSKKLDAYGIEAMAHLDLAKLYRHKKNPSKAKDHIQQAIPLFERSGAYVFLKQARELLEDLK
jgi:tetratricopeptide (TPR) repeat protein